MRTILIWFCLLFIGCSNRPFIPTLVNEHSADPSAVATKTVKPVSYIIRTRIVIEQIDIITENSDEYVAQAHTDSIQAAIQTANKVYKPAHIKLQVVETTIRSCVTSWVDLFEDAQLYPDRLSVYFVAPFMSLPSIVIDGEEAIPVGVSSAPWEPNPYGIIITWRANENTLAHELGHYLGLYHTFEAGGDKVLDTPVHNEPCDEEKCDIDPNCRNIMNYCQHKPKFLTLGQIERINRFVQTSRQSHMIFEQPSPIFVPSYIISLYNQGPLAPTGN